MKEEIHISSRQLKVGILPQYGAMVSGILFRGREILHMEESYLGKRNTRAGGIPVLFPFAGKTKDDIYSVAGKKYSMPMHGFLKDQKFEICSLKKDSCELTVCGDEEIYRNYFPFPYQVKIDYAVSGNVFVTEFTVFNLGDRDFACSLGFHPYFVTSDKDRLDFEFGMQEYWDYTRNGQHGMMYEVPNLAQKMDHVFCGVPAQDIVLHNPVEGYSVWILTDKSFGVTTINTGFPGTCCIEPWQGLPNAANTCVGIQLIRAGGYKSFRYRLVFEECAVWEEGR